MPGYSSILKRNHRNLTRLVDSFGRSHNYLRISLTEKCNLRCKYCMPAEGIQLTPRKDLLSLEEVSRLTEILVKTCGVDKIRLTGGEPSIDNKLLPLLSHLGTLRRYGLKTVGLTTNGINLRQNAKTYKELGVDGLNISLDTLREDRFQLITRRRGLNQTLDGLLAAIDAKFDSLKLNCVALKGVNEDELIDMAKLATKYPVEVRFIEFMPFAGNRWRQDLFLPYKQILDRLKVDFPKLERASAIKPGDVSKVFRNDQMVGSIGFISSMSENFCSGCNRLRITADGNLKVCLLGKEELSLRDLMRSGCSEEEIISSVQNALHNKRKQHAGAESILQDSHRPMVKIDSRQIHTLAGFSHLGDDGKVKMVNIGDKKVVTRIAIARGSIWVGDEIMSHYRDRKSIAKGDIETVAKLAGVMAAKRTSELIPLCHQINLDHIQIEVEPDFEEQSLVVTGTVETRHSTGVEMECLTAVSVSLLTIYDMCKSFKSRMIIKDVELISKIKR